MKKKLGALKNTITKTSLTEMNNYGNDLFICNLICYHHILFSGGNLSYEDLTQYIGHNPNQRDYYCTLCPNFNSKKPSTRVRDHLEAIHFPGQFIYECSFCEKTFNGKNLLAVHKSTKHPRKKNSVNSDI